MQLFVRRVSIQGNLGCQSSATIQFCSWSNTMLGTILLILLILMLLGAIPVYPYSRSWGYYPSGGLGMILLIVLILVLIGRI